MESSMIFLDWTRPSEYKNWNSEVNTNASATAPTRNRRQINAGVHWQKYSFINPRWL
jgi:hypothetical protein